MTHDGVEQHEQALLGHEAAEEADDDRRVEPGAGTVGT